jgi:hypothetical protein
LAEYEARLEDAQLEPKLDASLTIDAILKSDNITDLLDSEDLDKIWI